jgi:hypothetical protein
VAETPTGYEPALAEDGLVRVRVVEALEPGLMVGAGGGGTCLFTQYTFTVSILCRDLNGDGTPSASWGRKALGDEMGCLLKLFLLSVTQPGQTSLTPRGSAVSGSQRGTDHDCRVL